jgi:hypothetical protein
VRVSYLYYFLRGSSTQDRSVVFNGQEFTAGSLDTNADFSRLSLGYERTLFSRPSGEQPSAALASPMSISIRR